MQLRRHARQSASTVASPAEPLIYTPQAYIYPAAMIACVLLFARVICPAMYRETNQEPAAVCFSLGYSARPCDETA